MSATRANTSLAHLLEPENNPTAGVCSGDCCESAVKRAYQELRAAGAPPDTAWVAAQRVFAWHHPYVANDKAETILAHWLRTEAVH